MSELIGWIGGIAYAVCALPQAIKTYKTKSAKDFDWTFLLLWLTGSIFALTYIIITTKQAPLIFNYTFNGLCLLTIIYVKIYEVKR